MTAISDWKADAVSFAGPVCLFCGNPEMLAIADIWVDGNFLLGTCCEGHLEQVSADREEDPAWVPRI